jgi:lysophospholipase L1-like esterase
MATEPFVIVVWADSIAAGSKWPDTAQHAFNAVLCTGTPIRMINESTGGMPAAVARTQFDQRIAPHKPNLVVIQFGFNDLRYDGTRGNHPISSAEEFAGHLTHMVGRCTKELGAQVLLAMNHEPRSVLVMPCGRPYPQVVAAYNNITRRVAQDLGTHLIDMWGLANDTGTHRDDIVNEDGVHLSGRGTSFYACAMSNKFRTIVP